MAGLKSKGGTPKFEPEEIRMSYPWERGAVSAEQAVRQQSLAEKKFRRLFISEFIPLAISSWNADAKRLGLPPASRKWFLIGSGRNATLPLPIFERHRAVFMPKMFPDISPKEANRAYDMLLAKMRKAWKHFIESNPTAGILLHEMGHAETGFRNPELSFRHPERGKVKHYPTIINEAVASWHGFKRAWKLWSRWGIPRKAWGAWTGFPTYMSRLAPEQVDHLMVELERLDAKYPGLSDMARKVAYQYDEYVRPVLYNVPGKDWTDAEKKALRKWVEERGGKYREYLPKSEKERLRHLKSQPYVRKKKEPTGTAVASADMPLFRRAWLPLSRRAGDVVRFPSEKVMPTEKKDRPADIMEVDFSGTRFAVCCLGRLLEEFGTQEDAERHAEKLVSDFAYGRGNSEVWECLEDFGATEAAMDEYVDLYDPWDILSFLEESFLKNRSENMSERRDSIARDAVAVVPIPKGMDYYSVMKSGGIPQGRFAKVGQETSRLLVELVELAAAGGRE